jgi:hypothetical protein
MTGRSDWNCLGRAKIWRGRNLQDFIYEMIGSNAVGSTHTEVVARLRLALQK